MKNYCLNQSLHSFFVYCAGLVLSSNIYIFAENL